MQIHKAEAINSLGNWSFKMIDDDINQMTFYDNDGNEISTPTNFPNQADIDARLLDMQTKADTENYKSVQEIIATYG